MKKFVFTLIILIISVMTGSNAFAIEEIKPLKSYDLTFNEAYALMLENNNALKAAQGAIDKSKYEKYAAIGEFFPKIGVNAAYMHFSKPIAVTTDLMGLMSVTTPLQDKNVFTVSFGGVWNIFTGGKILALNAGARAKLEASNYRYKELENMLTVELVKRYYGLKLAKEVTAVKKQYSDGTKKHLNDAKLLEKQGMIAKSQRLHAQVAFENAQRDYKAALRDEKVIDEALKALIKDEKVNLKDVSIMPTSTLFIYQNSTIDIEKMKENAILNNPQLKMLEAKKKGANAAYHAEVANYMPTVSLFAYDIAGAKDLSNQVPRYTVGAMANYAIFDGFSRYNKTRAANVERKIVDFEIQDAKYNIDSLIEQQYQELMKNKERYESLNVTLTDANEALRTTVLGFREGYRTSLDVVDAQLALSKAKTEKLEAIYNYDLTLAKLFKTNGDTKEILNYTLTQKAETLQNTQANSAPTKNVTKKNVPTKGAPKTNENNKEKI